METLWIHHLISQHLQVSFCQDLFLTTQWVMFVFFPMSYNLPGFLFLSYQLSGAGKFTCLFLPELPASKTEAACLVLCLWLLYLMQCLVQNSFSITTRWINDSHSKPQPCPISCNSATCWAFLIVSSYYLHFNTLQTKLNFLQVSRLSCLSMATLLFQSLGLQTLASFLTLLPPLPGRIQWTVKSVDSAFSKSPIIYFFLLLLLL